MHLVNFFFICFLFFSFHLGHAQDTPVPSSFSSIDDNVLLYPEGFSPSHQLLSPSDSLPARWFISKSPFSVFPDGNKHQFSLDAFPVVEAQTGYDTKTKRVTHETFAGAGINLRWKNTFHLFALWGRGNTFQPAYTDSVSRQWGIVPGVGTAEQLGNGSWRFNNTKLVASYRLHPYVSVEAGYGKNFLGNGIRSLFLGDAASPYPFARINTRIGKISYTNLYCNLYDIRGSMGERSRFVNKYAAMHYLTWNITGWMQLNFFEAIVFPNRNQNGSGHFFDPNYLNPVIFLRPVEYSVGSPDNSLLGGGIQFKIQPTMLVYANVLLDEFLLSKVKEGKGWVENKQGLQAGLKITEPLKIRYLHLQAEVNWVRPYTYYHKNSLQNYAHMNQPLAHPLGANFSELLVKLFYARSKNMQWTGTLLYAEIGYDKNGLSYGQNVYQPYYLRPLEYGNKVGQGLHTQLFIADLTFSWIPEKNSGTCLFASVMFRGYSNEFSRGHSLIPSLGLRSCFLSGKQFF